MAFIYFVLRQQNMCVCFCKSVEALHSLVNCKPSSNYPLLQNMHTKSIFSTYFIVTRMLLKNFPNFLPLSFLVIMYVGCIFYCINLQRSTDSKTTPLSMHVKLNHRVEEIFQSVHASLICVNMYEVWLRKMVGDAVDYSLYILVFVPKEMNIYINHLTRSHTHNPHA